MKTKNKTLHTSLCKALFIIATFLISSNTAFSQKPGVKYTGTIEGDVLFGAFEKTGSVLTHHGIAYNNWKASVGTGLDFYRYRTVPVFLNVQRSFKLGKTQSFVEASGGVNIAHPTESEKLRNNWWGIWWPSIGDTLNFNNGYYSRLGVGLVLTPKSKIKLTTNAGWSYKTISERYEEYVYDGVLVRKEIHTNRYGLNRWYVGIGISF